MRFQRKQPWLDTGLSMVFSRPVPTDEHVVKIIGLDTSHIPAPAHLVGLHIDRIDQADFFSWAEGDVVRMTRERSRPIQSFACCRRRPARSNCKSCTVRPGWLGEGGGCRVGGSPGCGDG